MKGTAAEEKIEFPFDFFWDTVKYAVYCHVMWSAIVTMLIGVYGSNAP